MDNVAFLITPTDSYWVRDYGPWFVFDGENNPGIMDFPYNRPRPNDNNVPAAVAVTVTPLSTVMFPTVVEANVTVELAVFKYSA